jgi:hypothetical protein
MLEVDEYAENNLWCIFLIYENEKNDTYTRAIPGFAGQIPPCSRVAHQPQVQHLRPLEERESQSLSQSRASYDAHSYPLHTLRLQVVKSHEDDF